MVHAHQKCGQHCGSGGFDLNIGNPGGLAVTRCLCLCPHTTSIPPPPTHTHTAVHTHTHSPDTHTALSFVGAGWLGPRGWPELASRQLSFCLSTTQPPPNHCSNISLKEAHLAHSAPSLPHPKPSSNCTQHSYHVYGLKNPMDGEAWQSTYSTWGLFLVGVVGTDSSLPLLTLDRRRRGFLSGLPLPA